MKYVFPIYILPISLALLLGTGCKTTPTEMFKPSVANVDILHGGEQITVKVTANRFNKHSQIGVRHLQAEDWQLALDEFTQALTESPNDHATLFALGVASEQLGQLDKALEYYKRANAAKAGGQPDPQYIAAIKRTQSKSSDSK